MAGSEGNDYGCPDAVYRMMQDRGICTRLLRAIKRLGPLRVRWYSGAVSLKGGKGRRCPVAWCLDGVPTTEGALVEAAGLQGETWVNGKGWV